MIKLSDYVFSFLQEKKIKDVFMLPGGGAMHLVDSLGKSGMQYYHCQHEQAVAIAALAYGEHMNHLGVALVTSGPGATNTVTAVSAAWIDSVPMMVISGQAKTTDLVGDKGVRQIGSQEVNIVEIVKPITKYAVQIKNPKLVSYELEKAYRIATTGRKGPVWIDIPLDVQAAIINPKELQVYTLDSTDEKNSDLKQVCEDILSKMSTAKKPLILAGNGVYLSGATQIFKEWINNIGIPVQTTWKAIDLMYEEHPLYAGHPGLLGDRGANYIIQKCDLLLAIGARIDNSITAFNEDKFAPDAYKIFVDIDSNELKKFSMDVDITVCCDAYEFIETLMKCGKNNNIAKNKWVNECKRIREKYPVVTEKQRLKTCPISGYYFTECLCAQLNDDDIIVPESAGVTVEATLQAFKSKSKQRNKHAAGLGSMGFGLPYSIGACIANGKKRTVLINGDGAFQLNIQELETLHRLNLPIKIFIWNNEGYASIRGMQRNNFGGNYVGSEPESGCTIPSISRIASAYELKTFSIEEKDEINIVIKRVLEVQGPALCEVYIDPDEIVSPKVMSRIESGKMIPGTLDNMWPPIE